jgi:hypothetical protein
MPWVAAIPSHPIPDIKRLLDNAHGSMMEHMIDACAGGFYAAPMADEVEGFFVAHPVPGAQRKIAQVYTCLTQACICMV